MISEVDRQIGEFAELILEPERMDLPVNGYKPKDRIYTQDGRRLYQLGLTGELDDLGGEIGEYVAIDDKSYQVDSWVCHSSEEKQFASERYVSAGWEVIDTGGSLRHIAYMEKSKYEKIKLKLAREQLKK